jgi:hypothetical protein
MKKFIGQAVESAWRPIAVSSLLALLPVGADAEVDALTGFGLVGLELGPIGLFAKAGIISWDAEASVDDIGDLDESGTDPAYGVGARFSLGSVELRAEYELFDIEIDGTDSSDLSMLSAGIVWTF